MCGPRSTKARRPSHSAVSTAQPARVTHTVTRRGRRWGGVERQLPRILACGLRNASASRVVVAVVAVEGAPSGLRSRADHPRADLHRPERAMKRLMRWTTTASVFAAFDEPPYGTSMPGAATVRHINRQIGQSFFVRQRLRDFAGTVDEKLRQRAQRAVLQGDDPHGHAAH
jgi:hypothetical protein